MRHEVIVAALLLGPWLTSLSDGSVHAGTYSGSNSREYSKVKEILATDSVEVKQSGRNSLVAKEKALSIAARKAFTSLLRDHETDLVDPEDESGRVAAVLPLKDLTFSDREISDCVYDYSIENEKRSESVYICEVRYRFDSKQVVLLLQKHGVKCRSNGLENSNIKVVIYTEDFIRNSSRLYTKNCVVQKYSSEYVVLFIKNCTKEDFEKFGLRYALLQ